MIHFDLPKEKSSIIKVIGVGGGGSNAVNHMFNQNIEGVNFIICNTDAQAISQSSVPNKIQLGPHLTQGLGAGANPEIGKQATEESLEEIRRILEVNTKMAFITAGMGGGTGTGGAPIISQICKDLGILTVGIVTTPFSYEGKKRQIQAEEGIQHLKQYVDTLLVISNDKLRHQFGNLKMKEAFAKADNVLATAAKCITDVINSTGQINVDFADVCTVMRNGGVAILGNAAVEGESRAQKAIEEALNSPLLNDNEIKGARWILININSAEGEHEFTMDEVDIIQNELLGQAGESTDIILGLGYDNSLDKKIGITLIATGFEYKDPFYKKEEKQPEPKREEKIIMTLNTDPQPKVYTQASLLMDEEVKKEPVVNEPDKGIISFVAEETSENLREDLKPTLVEMPLQNNIVFFTDDNEGRNIVEETKPEYFELSSPAKAGMQGPNISQPLQQQANAQNNSVVSGGYLAKPANIYAEQPRASQPVQQTQAPYIKPVTPPQPNATPSAKEEEEALDMQLVVKNVAPSEPQRTEQPSAANNNPATEEPAVMPDEAEEQRRRAAERIQKLRNLSFNVNAADPNNEFETVPAYIRRNMELYNNSNPVENFYSNYTVKADENDKAKISTINTFLDGQKPD